MEETDLITASQAGDQSAFEQLIKPYQTRLYNFLFKMCQNKEAAEDMMQETLLNAFKKIKDFRGEAKFSSWLFQISTNNCLMHKRQISRAKADSLDEPINNQENKELADWSQNPAIVYDQKEIQEKLGQALLKVPEIYRAALILKDLEGFKTLEIAEMLSISEANVKARVLRARRMLSAELKKTGITQKK